MAAAYGHRRKAFLFASLLAAGRCALALNPALEVSQYAHKSWPIGESFLTGRVLSIAQTPDGYLWLGSEFGLLRFDGVHATAFAPPPGQHLPSDLIRCVIAGRNGTLWIGTGKGLASWKDGKLTTYAELDGTVIGLAGLFEDREGSIWVGGFALPHGKLCVIRKGSVRCDGADGRLGGWANGFYEDRKGNLWVGAESGLWRWKPGPPQLCPIPEPYGVRSVGGVDDAEPLIGTYGRLRRLVDGKAEAYSLPGQVQPSRAVALTRDRDGGLWIGTQSQGLTHVGLGRVDRFPESAGLSADSVLAIFEDRESNVWVSTDKGLDRFRDFAIPTISGSQISSTANVSVVLPARDGSVWIGTVEGLKRWNQGDVWAYREHHSPQREGQRVVREVVGSGLADRTVTALFQDHRGRIWVATPSSAGYLENDRFVPVRAIPAGSVQSIVEDTAGNLWFAHQTFGLIGLVPDGEVQRIPWTTLGDTSFAQAVTADPVGGGLWLGFFQAGIAYWKEGKVRATYNASNGLAGGYVNDLWCDRDGALWISTEGGLSRLKDGRIATWTRQNGLPCAPVHWAIEDDGHRFWLYTSCGLLRVARSELEAWASGNGGGNHAVLFDPFDGVRTVAVNATLAPHVAKSPDGRIWFRRADGVSVIDPGHLAVNTLSPPVSIEQIVADRKPYDANSGLRLPPLVRDLQIDYTALSFAAPEKVQFRLKLEGHDADWHDVGVRRQAFYSDLPPRKYRFRVAACNNSGVWNEAGASLDFSVAPAYYQTAWFQALCVAAFVGLLAGLYQLRLRQVARQFNMRIEERVNERTRIARDLHDTMLQSFQGVLMKLEVVTDRIKDPPEAREQLDTIVGQARQAVTEGRDTVQGLRSSTVTTNELARAIRAAGAGLADPKASHCPEFRVYVEGATRDCVPIVRDEVYRIACEAIRNAFRHAQAGKIEVDIQYGERRFRLCVRDDGKGIDSTILNAGGRTGHHGLPGMQERAALAGGKLAVFSRLGSGTEVELTIPAAFAYLKSNAAQR